jgi:hypothetical protein
MLQQGVAPSQGVLWRTGVQLLSQKPELQPQRELRVAGRAYRGGYEDQTRCRGSAPPRAPWLSRPLTKTGRLRAPRQSCPLPVVAIFSAAFWGRDASDGLGES